MEAIVDWIAGNKDFVAIARDFCKTTTARIVGVCDKDNWD